MFTGVPNLAWIFGYFRVSWTLRADLISDLVCRLLVHMAALGASTVTPQLRPEDADMPILPWFDPENFNPGYLMRSADLLRTGATSQSGSTARTTGPRRTFSRTPISTTAAWPTNDGLRTDPRLQESGRFVRRIGVLVEAAPALDAQAAPIKVGPDEVGVGACLRVARLPRPVVGDLPDGIEPDAVEHPERADGHP